VPASPTRRVIEANDGRVDPAVAIAQEVVGRAVAETLRTLADVAEDGTALIQRPDLGSAGEWGSDFGSVVSEWLAGLDPTEVQDRALAQHDMSQSLTTNILGVLADMAVGQ
jgi:hypothetical protein